MMKTLRLHGVAAAVVLLIATGAGAQDLVITNARIIDGTGKVMSPGAVVVTGGKLACVGACAATVAGVRVIDAGGKTVMPGLIDAHRHIVTGGADWLDKTAPKEMQEFLDAGFTTLLCALEPPPAVEAKNRINKGQLKGPRLYVAALQRVQGGPPGPAPAEDPARSDPARLGLPDPPAAAVPREVTIKGVEDAAKAGYDYLKVVLNATKNGPELETLKLIVSEGKKHNMPTIVHAVSVRDTLVAIQAKPDLLVHTPHIGSLSNDPDALKKIVDAKIPMTSTLSVFVPHFDEQGTALFRDRKAFPWNTLSSAGQGPVNARLLWEAGLVSYGYGTDTQWPPKETLGDELRALRLVFSPQQVVQIITKNAATATMHGAEIGTLEPGKLADIVIVDGDPLHDSNALQHVVTTIKGGEVVFEAKR
jgi:imidazolonepropionase-like amidohydrolase